MFAKTVDMVDMVIMVDTMVDTTVGMVDMVIAYFSCYVKAARPVPNGEIFMLSVRRSFMHRRASFPFPI